MAQKTMIVGIDVAKDKADVALRSAAARASFENTTAGRQELLRWLGEHQVGTAVMEASGGYEAGWAKLLRAADIEVRIVDPKRVRHFARGDKPAAARRWKTLLGMLPADAPIRAMLEAKIKEAE